MNWAFTTTKWTLDMATKLIKSDVRMHNVEAIEPNMAIIFVVNHFTRLETLLLPYFIYKHTNLEVWSLAAADLFHGRLGEYMQKMGTVSTQDPDRDRNIIRSLLAGNHPWIIFPEGAMIKDKKVIDHRGMFRVYDSKVGSRPPHTGPAVLALRAEFYRHKLECIANNPHHDEEELRNVLSRFNLESVDQALAKRTVIIPVNITYFPMRSQENIVLRMAKSFAKDLSKRSAEELSVEGTLISHDTDIDITLGDPIDVANYLHSSEYAELMACGPNDLAMLEEDAKSVFNEAARRLMYRYMSDIYRFTTINYDHIFATIIRHQRAKRFTERAYRNRIFLCAHNIKSLGYHRLHSILERTYRDILYEDWSPKFHNFIDLCEREGKLQKEGNAYIKNFDAKQGEEEFHSVRQNEITYVIANEIEPLTSLVEMIKGVARMPRAELSRTIRNIFLHEDQRIFEEDYERWFDPEQSKAMEIGRPFLLLPRQCRAGVVLVHGYMAAPEEVRGLANYLFNAGFAVYAVRLKGHGTSPADLATSRFEDWYESLNRGYAIIKSLTDTIVLGGFSTGGALSLLAAGRKRDKITATFAINAPLKLQRFGARVIAPTIVSMTSLMKRVKDVPAEWEYVENHPENRHINYFKNPLRGVTELGKSMDAMEAVLKDICVPTLVIQGSKDPIVHPESGPEIFERIGTKQKELMMFPRERHGIINGENSADICDRITHFLEWATTHSQSQYAIVQDRMPSTPPSDIASESHVAVAARNS